MPASPVLLFCPDPAFKFFASILAIADPAAIVLIRCKVSAFDSGDLRLFA